MLAWLTSLVVKTELSKDCENSQAVDQVRRQEAIQAIRVRSATLNDEVLLEQIRVLNDAQVFKFAILGNQFGLDRARGQNGLTRAVSRNIGSQRVERFAVEVARICHVEGVLLIRRDCALNANVASNRITLIADELLKVRSYLDAKMEESCDSDIS